MSNAQRTLKEICRTRFALYAQKPRRRTLVSPRIPLLPLRNSKRQASLCSPAFLGLVDKNATHNNLYAERLFSLNTKSFAVATYSRSWRNSVPI